jgi:hypothetical protein
LISISTVPTVILRNDGVILRASTTFAEVLGISRQALETDDWRFCDLLTEESFVNHAEKLAIAYFDLKQAGVVTNCVLVKGGMRKFTGQARLPNAVLDLVKCGMTVALRRDTFQLPVLLIVTVLPMMGTA